MSKAESLEIKTRDPIWTWSNGFSCKRTVEIGEHSEHRRDKIWYVLLNITEFLRICYGDKGSSCYSVETELKIDVVVYEGHQDKYHTLGDENIFFLSQFWRTEVWNQGVEHVFSEILRGRSFLAFS